MKYHLKTGILYLIILKYKNLFDDLKDSSVANMYHFIKYLKGNIL